LGTWWSLGGGGYPFGPDGDPQPPLSILGGIPTQAGAVGFAVTGALSAIAAGLMLRGVERPDLRRGLAIFGVVVGLTAAVLIPDYRILVAVAYAPIFLVAAPFGLTGNVSFFDALTPTVLHQFALMIGGLALVGLSVFAWRAGRGWWTNPVEARRWGRRAVVVAVIVPVVYALTRWAWALGIPFGVSEDFLRQGADSGMWLAGAALATLAVVGAILTTGLILPWGETFPGWLPLVGGRRVPVGLAVVPALIVAAMVTAAGNMFIRMILAGADFGGLAEIGALAPEVLWPAWGVALAVAAVTYGVRRSERER
jgi:hypothetical protein